MVLSLGVDLDLEVVMPKEGHHDFESKLQQYSAVLDSVSAPRMQMIKTPPAEVQINAHKESVRPIKPEGITVNPKPESPDHMGTHPQGMATMYQGASQRVDELAAKKKALQAEREAKKILF